MKKFFAILLAVMLVASMAVPAFAATPALKIPNVPQISKIEIKLGETTKNAIANHVNKWFAENPIKFDFEFTNIKLGG